MIATTTGRQILAAIKIETTVIEAIEANATMNVIVAIIVTVTVNEIAAIVRIATESLETTIEMSAHRRTDSSIGSYLHFSFCDEPFRAHPVFSASCFLARHC